MHHRRRLASLLLVACFAASAAAAQDRRPPPPPPPRAGQPPPPRPGQPPPRPEPASPARQAPAPAGSSGSSPVAAPAPAAASPTAAEEAAVAAARARGDSPGLGAALLALAAEHTRLGRSEQALPVLEETIALADRTGDDRLGREAAFAAATIYAGKGDRDMERLWRERADAYRLRIASRIGAAPGLEPSPLPPPPTGGDDRAGSAPAGVDAVDRERGASSTDPGAGHPARWAWLLLPISLGIFWMWLRSTRKAEALRAEADRLARHQRQLRTANTALQEQASRLREAAVQDPLTGAMTRPAFARQFEDMLLHASHYGKPVALMVFDLDHFKQINDTHGHMSGDAALRFVAGVVRETLASDDLFGRFGGDEFLIGCADHAPEAALRVAEHLRIAVTTRAGQADPAFAALSLSMGIAIADSDSGWRSELLFHRADAALYAAKRAGRNCSVLEGSDTPEPPPEIHAPRTLSA